MWDKGYLHHGLRCLMAAPIIRRGLFAAIGGPRHSHGRRVRWDQMDLSDPEHPKLRCPVEELTKLVRR